MNILYLVNTISTTSFPLDVVEEFQKNPSNRVQVAYLSNLDEQRIKNFNSIKIRGGKACLFWNVIELIRVIKNNKINIVHTHHFYTSLIARLAKLIYGDFKLVTTFHTDLRRYGLLKRRYLAFLIKQSNGLIFNSESTESSVNESFSQLPYNKVIYNGIKVNEIKTGLDRKGQPKTEGVKICMVGRLVPVKNYPFIIKALSKIKTLNYNLTIYGDGVLREHLVNLVADLDLSKKIKLRGLVTRQQLLSELYSYDIFINSSLYEGFGNALIEAKIAGLHVLAPDLKVFHEILGSKITYFKNNDQLSFIQSFYSLLETETVEEDIRAISEKYSLQKHVENIEKFYQNCS
ncbi:glycosyltransferase [Akkermansiaceae bacterium]|nr:glycosyltransferase [Akkermansiaceae bacterium]MDA7790065.1 glycosyltransferase [Akkermansiaceae bacterium]MDA7872305.1 glycosyltransferase [Akkermansiaceae bacterium]